MAIPVDEIVNLGIILASGPVFASNQSNNQRILYLGQSVSFQSYVLWIRQTSGSWPPEKPLYILSLL